MLFGCLYVGLGIVSVVVMCRNIETKVDDFTEARTEQLAEIEKWLNEDE